MTSSIYKRCCRCCFPVVVSVGDVVDVKTSRSPKKQRKDEGDVNEKLSEMVIFSLHPQKKKKAEERRSSYKIFVYCPRKGFQWRN
jgi:hypothetical protein